MFNRSVYFLSLLLFCSCGDKVIEKKTRTLSEEFKNYWYNGEAEITSYKLTQARYGELREGTAVKIFVTEDFLPGEQVKANNANADNISVLKLNSTKNFITGIYPYSIMESCFYPLAIDSHALKISASIQEWCGQVYMQLNNRHKYEVKSHSYFAGEADKEQRIEKVALENEIWTKIRVLPNDLPVGNFEMLPSFEFLRLSHKETKPYSARGEYFTEDSLHIYSLEYPELNRKLKIYFTRSFPHSIERWEETYPSGSGKDAEILTTIAKKKQRIKTAYWKQNSNKHIYLRDKLELN
ncbi:septum formation inhibitor Maf [Christiangramia salexigens]|uniref:Septum formation inhibitor Maf n=1 Tax=Christiangramia salexigens TaxID=1913577 RepID=A0A1L3J898_9FLAO|nr:septum formation inhibitor Maf [Christiangramia salexigens]APG61356.1 septum formation inhibitor Maf [Christiangramia salexigens]